jgi:hypothetical protein
MKNRTKQGSTLSLVIACAIVIILLGIGFIFMGFIFGGHTESQHAADSGSLNVAKNAINAPFLPVSSLGANDAGLAMAACLTPPPGYPSDSFQGLNLFNFNRMVGQAMLVGLNADAEGSGQADAQIAVQFVEGSASSLGGQLQSTLAAPAWASTDYQAITGNVLRMLVGQNGAAQGAPTFQNSDFQIGYMDALPSDISANLNATNIDMSVFTSGNAAYNAAAMPFNYTTGAADAFKNATVPGPNGTALMAGYVPMQTGSGGSALTIYGVPINPGMQPHLVSSTLFNQEETQPGAGSVWLPPNAFAIGATATLQSALQSGNPNAQNHVYSVSTVGTQQAAMPLSIPGGYMIVNNQQGTTSFPFMPPNTDNAFATELGTNLLQADPATGIFSYGPGPGKGANLINQWQNFNHSGPFPGTAAATAAGAPPLGGSNGTTETADMYNSAGQDLNSMSGDAGMKAAWAIPYSPSGPSLTVCNDNNSGEQGTGSATAVCGTLANPMPYDAFDTAYHPDLTQTTTTTSVPSLTAAEMAQCETITLYGHGSAGSTSAPAGGGSAELFAQSYGPTGLRMYSGGLPTATQQYAWQGSGPAPSGTFGMAPSSSQTAYNDSTGASLGTAKVTDTGYQTALAAVEPGICQVTEKGTMLDLFNMVTQAQNQFNASNGITGSPQGGCSVQTVKNFLNQRMLEIYPQATAANMDAITGPVPLPTATSPSGTVSVANGGNLIDNGSVYYIYYSASSPQNGNQPGLAMSTTAPPVVAAINANKNDSAAQMAAHLQADGNIHQVYSAYDVLQGVVNPYFCYGIHDRLFTTWGNNAPSYDNMEGAITAYDTAAFQPGSGAYGNLGSINFSEYVMPGPANAGWQGGFTPSGPNPPVPGFPPSTPTNPPTFNNRD